jgi:hypothetical protein
MITSFNTSLFILYYYITTRTHTKNGKGILFFIVPVPIDGNPICFHHHQKVEGKESHSRFPATTRHPDRPRRALHWFSRRLAGGLPPEGNHGFRRVQALFEKQESRIIKKPKGGSSRLPPFIAGFCYRS